MLSVDKSKNSAPLYMQLYKQIKAEIQDKLRPAGSRLPSKRKLAATLAISVNTIEAAYGQLVSEGFIEARPQRGYFVCRLDELQKIELKEAPTLPAQTPLEQIKIDFSPESIDKEKFPYNTWRRLLKNCFDEYDKALLDCPPAQGFLPLREDIASYLYQARGVHCQPQQVIVGAGTDNLLQMTSRLLDNRYCLALENPFYPYAANLFQRVGHEVRFIDVDKHGIRPQALPDLQRIAVYVTPSHQFPSGVFMPINRRIELLNWASDGQERYLIEDDYDSEFRYNARPIASLQSLDRSGRVIYLGTFSKAVAPALRISYMVLPPALLKVYKQRYAAFAPAASGFEQRVLHEFISSGAFEAHLNKMRKLYRQKRQLLADSVNSWGKTASIGGENAGHHLLLRLNNGLTEEQMCQQALAARVRVYPLSRYFHSRVPKQYQSTVLLGYAGLSEQQITEGAKLLQAAWLNG